jgi:GTP-binding protein Era
VVAKLPVAPPFYDDPEQLTDRSLRWLAAECIREAVFEELEQELPYSTAVEIDSFDESRADLVRIRAQLLVERDSQKRIVIGSGGEQVKKIGTRARETLEALLETRVFLELWVKVEPRWAKRPKRLAALGYR